MSDDLVQRLRLGVVLHSPDYIARADAMMKKAADEIERLQAKVEKLELEIERLLTEIEAMGRQL